MLLGRYRKLRTVYELHSRVLAYADDVNLIGDDIKIKIWRRDDVNLIGDDIKIKIWRRGRDVGIGGKKKKGLGECHELSDLSAA